MKYIEILLMLSVLIIMITVSCSIERTAYRIYDTQTGRNLSLQRFARSLAEYDVVIFGEFHGHDVIHNIQAELLPQYLKEVNEFSISLEMFERDVQSVVDQYLNGLISEEEFIESSRPWHTYKTDYRPIIEFAKDKNLSVIASNLPRRMAREINRNGIEWIETISLEESMLIAREVTMTEDAYRDRFNKMMLDGPHITSHDHRELQYQLDNLYAAQSAKDDTMAESISRFLRNNPNVKVIHINGDFHSNSRLGVVTKLKQRKPDISIGVISPVLKDEDIRINSPKDYYDQADYIISVQKF